MSNVDRTASFEFLGIQLDWDLDTGLFRFAGTPTLAMWIPSTVAGLMAGMHRMVGTERFNLCMQAGGRESVKDDWGYISSFPTFEDGITKMSDVANMAGWGRWEIVSVDREARTGLFRTHNQWESIYQRSLGVDWGSRMQAGKWAGICSELFGTHCQVEQTQFITRGSDYDEFRVFASDVTEEAQLENLLGEATSKGADLAVALEKLRQENEQRKAAEDELRRNLETIRRQQESLRKLSSPIIEVWDDVMVLPVIGVIDADRAADMTNALLDAVVSSRSGHAIIDLTGVEMVDTNTANHIFQMTRAAQLVGCRLHISGITPGIARTVASLGVEMSDLRTFGTLKAALQHVIGDAGGGIRH